jgi:GMP synthase-like glutamine amidotransferase
MWAAVYTIKSDDSSNSSARGILETRRFNVSGEFSMRIHALQHVPFEDIGSMAQDFHQAGYSLATTHWYRGDAAPALDSFDALVVMGGPMGVYDEAEFPWLAAEKSLIAAAITADKIVLGICLGAQLIACASGAAVTRNPYKEIGWFPLVIQAPDEPVARALENMDVFHWHGDTFELPEGAVWLASSEGCKNQAFRLGQRVFGFQFHLETTPTSAAALLQHCADDLQPGPYVQTAAMIQQHHAAFANINRAMSAVLREIFQHT